MSTPKPDLGRLLLAFTFWTNSRDFGLDLSLPHACRLSFVPLTVQFEIHDAMTRTPLPPRSRLDFYPRPYEENHADGQDESRKESSSVGLSSEGGPTSASVLHRYIFCPVIRRFATGLLVASVRCPQRPWTGCLGAFWTLTDTGRKHFFSDHRTSFCHGDPVFLTEVAQVSVGE